MRSSKAQHRIPLRPPRRDPPAMHVCNHHLKRYHRLLRILRPLLGRSPLTLPRLRRASNPKPQPNRPKERYPRCLCLVRVRSRSVPDSPPADLRGRSSKKRDRKLIFEANGHDLNSYFLIC